jgi:hypothetical protein
VDTGSRPLVLRVNAGMPFCTRSGRKVKTKTCFPPTVDFKHLSSKSSNGCTPAS